MSRLLLAIPLLLGLAQDPSAIQDLIKRLDDSDLETREKAVRDLIKAGSKALEPLRRALSSESAEVRVRAAQALKAIESGLQAREVYPEPKALSLKRTGSVGEILDDLGRMTGARFDAAPEHRELKAAVESSTLLQALDQVCAGQPKLTYSFGDDGTVRFASEPHAASPASYFEAFKIFVSESNTRRKSDFKAPTVMASVSIHTAWEPRLNPIKRVRYEFTEAKDDAGRDVELVPGSGMDMIPMGGGAFILAGAFGDEADSSGPQTFSLKGLVPEAKSLSVLKGKTVVSFALARVDVAFEDPQSPQSQTVGDVTVKIKNVSTRRNRITLAFSKSKGDATGLKDEILGRLETGSARAIDEEGKEHVGEIGPAQADPAAGMVVVGGPGVESAKTTQLHAIFPTLGGKDFKRLKFRFADAIFEKSVPFELKDIRLP